MTDQEVFAKVKARIEVLELAIEGLKYEIAQLEKPIPWNPCQSFHEKDADWP